MCLAFRVDWVYYTVAGFFLFGTNGHVKIWQNCMPGDFLLLQHFSIHVCVHNPLWVDNGDHHTLYIKIEWINFIIHLKPVLLVLEGWESMLLFLIFLLLCMKTFIGCSWSAHMIASVVSPSAILSHGQANLFMNAVYSWWSWSYYLL